MLTAKCTTHFSDSLTIDESFETFKTLTENSFSVLDSKYTDKIEGVIGRMTGSICNYSVTYIVKVFADSNPADDSRIVVVEFDHEEFSESGEWYVDHTTTKHGYLPIADFIEKYGFNEKEFEKRRAELRRKLHCNRYTSA